MDWYVAKKPPEYFLEESDVYSTFNLLPREYTTSEYFVQNFPREIRVEFVSSKTFIKFWAHIPLIFRNVSFMNSPEFTMTFQVQVPCSTIKGYPGVEKLRPSPVIFTTEFFPKTQAPDVTEKGNHVFFLGQIIF